MHRLLSPLLVGAQLSLMGGILWWTPFPAHFLGWVGPALGLGIGLWAIGTMQRSKLNVFPEVRGGAHLVRTGPYRWIRHPMYTSVLTIMGTWVAATPNGPGAIMCAVLTVVLWVKLRYEEGLLRRAFPDYEAYQQETKRLIPHII